MLTWSQISYAQTYLAKKTDSGPDSCIFMFNMLKKNTTKPVVFVN